MRAGLLIDHVGSFGEFGAPNRGGWPCPGREERRGKALLGEPLTFVARTNWQDLPEGEHQRLQGSLRL